MKKHKQVNNKTAAKFFLQNQPVAARGINNKNFHNRIEATAGASEHR